MLAMLSKAKMLQILYTSSVSVSCRARVNAPFAKQVDFVLPSSIVWRSAITTPCFDYQFSTEKLPGSMLGMTVVILSGRRFPCPVFGYTASISATSEPPPMEITKTLKEYS
ncbi:hypothetical protein BD309DRAFT_610432 [Dichomitus squalens]|nr:hypothetical protein BD309DRAFT_610432 [Dichomitus squalens]